MSPWGAIFYSSRFFQDDNQLPHSGLRHQGRCEIFGLFRDIIPVEALNEEEGLRYGRGRQGLLPDFRFDLPGQGGGPVALGHVEPKLPQN